MGLSGFMIKDLKEYGMDPHSSAGIKTGRHVYFQALKATMVLGSLTGQNSLLFSLILLIQGSLLIWIELFIFPKVKSFESTVHQSGSGDRAAFFMSIQRTV